MATTTKEALDHAQASAKAQVLIESLPWLKKFRDTIMVIKFGGNAMVDEELLAAFAEDIVYLHHAGIRPVVVHGGGPQINRMLARLGIESEFRGGYRVTTPETMDVVRMVLTGKVNPELIESINAHGPFASGTTGEDGGLFIGKRRPPIEVDGESVDLGRVGDIVGVRTEPILALLEAGMIPVVSSIAPDADHPGESLNVNADAAASALASALEAEKLVILTDVAGLYANWPDKSSLVSTISISDLEKMLPSLESGMIPKMRACLDAVRGGVSKAAIIDGREPHSVLLEIFTEHGIGTEVVPD
ncbi:acetylglutamate kinase [Leucobacter sp. cx-42]|uniref:acetylglutamate kinase n=1 Tax=unclassified Leucobacter TaxID=2621730 RepID=UPI00165D31AF|nr:MULTISPECIES: acetylglutamate kinase [unclassified Leucobacter]MBC9954202.1 acetylglutamate kinase [Leucobacter sp. cx-42]